MRNTSPSTSRFRHFRSHKKEIKMRACCRSSPPAANARTRAFEETVRAVRKALDEKWPNKFDPFVTVRVLAGAGEACVAVIGNEKDIYAYNEHVEKRVVLRSGVCVAFFVREEEDGVIDG